MSEPSDPELFTHSRGESGERLLQLIENVKDYAIFMLETGGHVKTWNQGAERLKGYTAQEIIMIALVIGAELSDMALPTVGISRGRYGRNRRRARQLWVAKRHSLDSSF